MMLCSAPNAEEKKWKNVDAPPPPEVSIYPTVAENLWDRVTPHVDNGISNFGNTCFISATLQVLFHVPNFIKWLQYSQHHVSCKQVSCMTCHLLKTWRQMRSCKSPFLRPYAFVAAVRAKFVTPDHGIVSPFKKSVAKQEDAHEFLNFLLDQLHEDCISQDAPNGIDFISQQTTPISRIFGGWLKTKCTCLNVNCGSVSQTYAPFSCVTLNVTEVSSVQAAVGKYFEPECQDFKCSTCKQSGDTNVKQFEIHQAANTLILVLLRFKSDGTKIDSRVKLDNIVSFPDGSNYSLAGAVLHLGMQSKQGHYIAIAKCNDESFREFNDQTVKDVDCISAEKYEKNAYILIYTKKTVIDASPSKKSKFVVSNYIQPTLQKDSVTNATSNVVSASPGSKKQCLFKVAPLIIARSKRTEPKVSSSQSSHDYEVVSQVHRLDQNEDLGCKPLADKGEEEPSLPPLVIARTRRRSLKVSSSQSSHDYGIVSQTHRTDVVDNAGSKNLVAGNSVVVPPSDSQTIHGSATVTLNENEDVGDAPLFDTTLCRTGSQVSVFQDLQPIETDLQSEAESETYHNLEDEEVDFDFEADSASVCSKSKSAINWEADDSIHSDLSEDTASSQSSDNVENRKNFQPIILTENDVEGAALPKLPVSSNNMKQLKRYLYCRGLKLKGDKATLIERVTLARAKKDSHLVKLNVDKGKWYDLKLASLNKPPPITSTQSILPTQENLSFPTDGWKPFPSEEIPVMFNYGHIYHYLVESRPSLPIEEEEDLDVDMEESTRRPAADPFDEEYASINEVETLRKGLRFLKSEYVRAVEDKIEGRCYFVRAQVRASMSLAAREASVGISLRSGSVHMSSCTCVQPLGRCNHVCAVLLFIWRHVRLNGFGALTCTSLPCVWNKGSLTRDPGQVRDKQYESFKINVKRRAYFDPRPTLSQTSELTQEEVNNFVADLSGNPTETLFQRHLKIIYPDEDYSSEELEALSNLCEQFSEGAASRPEGSRGLFLSEVDGILIYELPETRGQSKSKMWSSLRSVHMTGTTAHTVLHLKSENAKMNFLRRHLWDMQFFTNAATKYGTTNEKNALNAYMLKRRRIDRTATAECNFGLIKRDDLAEGAASVDAIVYSDINETRLVEIKCPYTLQGVHPKKFRKKLTAKQRSSFCLGWNKTRGIFLKKKHSYYAQIQWYLGILRLDFCDFVVWSQKGSVVLEIKFDVECWELIQEAQKTFHRQYLVPEYFLMRTPRNLHPRPWPQ